jgi:hypothetical protein
VGQRKNWRWFESPDTIQTQSPGLGLYFKTLVYFIIVAVAMSAVGVAPLITNYTADKFKDSYKLVDERTETQCPRGYQVCCATSNSGGRLHELTCIN